MAAQRPTSPTVTRSRSKTLAGYLQDDVRERASNVARSSNLTALHKVGAEELEPRMAAT